MSDNSATEPESEEPPTGGARKKKKPTKADLEDKIRDDAAKMADMQREIDALRLATAASAQAQPGASGGNDPGKWADIFTNFMQSQKSFLDSVNRDRHSSQSRSISYKGAREPEKLDLDAMKHKAVELWVESFRAYLKLSGLASQSAELQVLAFKNLCTFDTLMKVNNLGVPQGSPVPDWLDAVLAHSKKLVCAVIERQALGKRKQKAGESVKEFYLALRVLSADCKYTDDQLKIDLKRVFIDGLQSKFLRKEILKFEELDEMELEQFVKQVTRLEQAEANDDKYAANDFQGTESVGAVKTAYRREKQGFPQRGQQKKATANTASNSESQCKRCQLKKCNGNPCETVCHNCNGKGHSRRTCRKPKVQKQQGQQRQIRNVEAEPEEDEDEGEVDIRSLRVQAVKASELRGIVVRMFRGGKFSLVKMLPDTGAAVSCITREVAERLDLKYKKPSVKIKMADESVSPSVVGEVLCSVRFNNITLEDHAFIVLEKGSCLLSKDACVDLGLLPVDFPFHVAGEDSDVLNLQPDEDDLNLVETASEGELDREERGENWRPCNILSDVSEDSDVDTGPKQKERESPVHHKPGAPNGEKPKKGLGTGLLRAASVFDRLGPLPKNPGKQDIADIKNLIMKYYADVIIEGKTPPMKGDPFVIQLQEDATPFAVKTPRPVPHMWTVKLKDELGTLVTEDVIEAVFHPTPWVSPIVVVPRKGSDRVRLCVDYTKLNRAIDRAYYFSPSPSVSVSDIPRENAKWFVKLDCLLGYHQVPVDEKSRDLTTFITPFGRYRYKRAPFGISNIPEVFNRKMEGHLRTQDHLQSERRCVDDVLIFAPTFEKVVWNTLDFLDRCRAGGVSISKKKFEFCAQQMSFAGYQIDNLGYRPAVELVKPIVQFPGPKKVSDLRAFLGLANQFGAAKPQLAEKLEPLRHHLKGAASGQKLNWTKLDQEAFVAVKRYLSSTNVLAFFDLKLETKLVADASRVGLGFVLLQKHGSKWRPAQCGSRVITPTEKNYSMIELEALASAWAMNKCRLFLLGLPFFILETDHRPLVSIMNDRRLDELDSDRLRRIKSKTTNFNFKTVWIKGSLNIAADCLSRYPIEEDPTLADQLGELEEAGAGKFVHVNELKVSEPFIPPPNLDSVAKENLTVKDFKAKAYADELYNDLMFIIRRGFPATKAELPHELREFWKFKESLSMLQGLITFGPVQAYVPPSMVQSVIETNHKGAHLGANKSVRYMDQFYWWPGMTTDVTNFVLSCPVCQARAPANRSQPDVGFSRTQRPLQYWHLDSLKEGGKHYTAMIDQETDWLAVWEAPRMTGAETVGWLDFYCATIGKPDGIFSDGGPNFKNRWVDDWCAKRRVIHDRSPPYYPKGNAQAESGVYYVKQRIRALLDERVGNTAICIQDVRWAVMKYNNAPSKDGVSPNMKVFGRTLNDGENINLGANTFDERSPWWQKIVARREKIIKTQTIDKLRQKKDLAPIEPGMKVAVKDLRPGEKGLFSRFGEVLGRDETGRTYYVQADDGKLIKAPREHLRIRRLAQGKEHVIERYLNGPSEEERAEREAKGEIVQRRSGRALTGQPRRVLPQPRAPQRQGQRPERTEKQGLRPAHGRRAQSPRRSVRIAERRLPQSAPSVSPPGKRPASPVAVRRSPRRRENSPPVGPQRAKRAKQAPFHLLASVNVVFPGQLANLEEKKPLEAGIEQVSIDESSESSDSGEEVESEDMLCVRLGSKAVGMSRPEKLEWMKRGASLAEVKKRAVALQGLEAARPADCRVDWKKVYRKVRPVYNVAKQSQARVANANRAARRMVGQLEIKKRELKRASGSWERVLVHTVAKIGEEVGVLRVRAAETREASDKMVGKAVRKCNEKIQEHVVKRGLLASIILS